MENYISKQCQYPQNFKLCRIIYKNELFPGFQISGYYALCDRTQRPDTGKNKGRVQSHQKTTDLLRRRRAGRRSAFLSAQIAAGKQHGDDVHDARPAAVLSACHVRKERSAAGKGACKHPARLLFPSQAAALSYQQLLRRDCTAGPIGQGGASDCLRQSKAGSAACSEKAAK